MDALIAQVQDTFEGQIDFEGQRISELVCTVLLSVSAVLALIIGYVKQDIYLTLWVGLGGTVLTMLAVVPPWPFYNQHPQRFLPSGKTMASMPQGGIVVGGKAR